MTKGEVRNPPRNEVQLRLLQVGAATIDHSKLLIFGAAGEDAGRLNVAGVADVAIDRAVGFIDGSGVVPQLEAWSDEYRTMLRGSHGRAGRRSEFSIRHILILILLTLFDEKPVLLTKIDELLSRLTSEQAGRIGIPSEAMREKGRYSRLHRAFDSWIDSLDPFPSERRTRVSVEEHERLTEEENNDPNVEVMLARLDWLANHLVEASVRALPATYRDIWRGNIAVDATLFGAFARRTTNVIAGRVSTDRDTGSYVRGGNHDGDSVGANRKQKVVNGYEATLAVMIPNSPLDNQQFPNLVVGMAFHRPGKAFGPEAVNCTASIRQRGHPAGFWLGDAAYTQSLPEKLRFPLITMGYEMILDLSPETRADGVKVPGKTGVQGGAGGGLQLAGRHFCPATPQALLDEPFKAALVFQDRSLPKDESNAARERLATATKAMHPYELKQKQKPKPGGPLVLTCPASGPNATVACPLKPGKSPGLPPGRVLLPIMPTNLPEHPGKICTNEESVSIPFEQWARHRQGLMWGSEEFLLQYAQRTIVEGYNGYLKENTPEQAGQTGRRRLRGHAAQYVLASFLVSASNLRKVRSFLINPPVPSKRAKPQPKNDVDATAHWAVTPTPMELSEREMARRRLIADRRRGEDVKAARRTGNTDEVARLIAARDLRRRKKRRLSRLQALKQAS
jgi:hypothetical protein